MQNSAELLKYSASNKAVSGVIPRLPRISSLTRLIGIFIFFRQSHLS